MKKIKKADLKLDKEVISGLTATDLEGVKGGLITNKINTCPMLTKPMCPVPFTKTEVPDDKTNCFLPAVSLDTNCGLPEITQDLSCRI